MKSNALLLLASLLLLLSGMVHAEGICPPGMYSTNPPGMPGPISCAPIPSYAQNPGQQAAPQIPQQPPERWQDHFGAIATDTHVGALGAATNLVNQDNAATTAIADCRSKGGLACKIEIVYRNECAAMIVGHPGYAIATGTIMSEAAQKGMKMCTESGNTSCHVYYSACSLPVRIQ
jgi:hypothetical protein